MNAVPIPAQQQRASEPEQRLLDFVASLIIEVARTHPRITEAQVALWLARAVLGAKR